MEAQRPIAQVITDLCKEALKCHDAGEDAAARTLLRDARERLAALTDASTHDHAQKLIDAVHGQLRRPAGLQQLN